MLLSRRRSVSRQARKQGVLSALRQQRQEMAARF